MRRGRVLSQGQAREPTLASDDSSYPDLRQMRRSGEEILLVLPCSLVTVHGLYGQQSGDVRMCG